MLTHSPWSLLTCWCWGSAGCFVLHNRALNQPLRAHFIQNVRKSKSNMHTSSCRPIKASQFLHTRSSAVSCVRMRKNTMCEHVGLQLMIIFNTVDTIKSNPHNHFMKNLISSLLTSQGFIIYFHRLHPKCLFFPSFIIMFLPHRKRVCVHSCGLS